MATASNSITRSFADLVKAPLTFVETRKPVSKSDPIDAFDTLIQRLDLLKKESVLEKIRLLENKEALLDTVFELVNTRNYPFHSDFFLNSKFEYYALAAVQEKKITPRQFGTLMFARSGLSEKVKIEDMSIVHLFDKGAPATDAWNYINETLTIKWQERSSDPLIDKNELAQFFEIMRTLPISEQSFILIPDTRDPFDPSQVINISYNVNFQQRFNAFCGLEIKERRIRMIPSLGMVQALLDATGADGFRLKLVLGESTPESLRLSVLNDNAREMCIHCPEIAPAPSEADGSPAPPMDFMYHDIYHAWTCRFVPKKHRQFFCELAAVVNPDNFSSRAGKQAAEPLYLTLLDLDFVSYYRPDLWGRSIDIEWASFRAIEFALGFFVEVRKRVFPSKEMLTEEEQRKSQAIFVELKNKLNGLFAIWKLYKKNYNNFEEITDYFDQLPPQLQQDFGKDFLELKKLLERCLTLLITPQELANLKIDEFGEVTKFVESGFSNLTYLVEKGIPFNAIWELPPKKREILMQQNWELRQLLEGGIPFQSIIELDCDLFQHILSPGGYFPIIGWMNKGIKFNKITALLRDFIKQEFEETISFCVLENVMTSNCTFDDFLELELPTRRSIFKNIRCVEELIKCGVPSKKVIHCDLSQLEDIFTYISDHRIDKSYKWIDVAEMMNRNLEFRNAIEKLGRS